MAFSSEIRLSKPLAMALFCLLVMVSPVAISRPVLGAEEKVEIPEAKPTVVHPAAFLDSVPPVYPAIARKAEMEGTVVVQATINALGDLVRSKLIQGVNPMLNKAALLALRSSSFLPARCEGEPCSGELLVSYPFDLDLSYGEAPRRQMPPMDWTPPLISDVGELLETRGSGKGKFGVFSYNGLRVHGDLSVAILESAMEQVRPRLAEGEKVISIRHPLAYKEFDGSLDRTPCDLEIITCTRRREDGTCHGGNIYPFVNHGGVYTLDLSEGLQMMWIH